MSRTKNRCTRYLGFNLFIVLTLSLLIAPTSSTHASTAIRQTGTTYPSSPNIPLPSGATTATMSITNTATINDLEVYLDIGHGSLSSLVVQLSHVQTGTTILLASAGQICNNVAYIQFTYDDEATTPPSTCVVSGSKRPASALSAFDAQSIQGDWDLKITNGSSTNGRLREWRLIVNSDAPANTAPVASTDLYTTDEDTPLTISAPGVLNNDTDADSDPLSANLTTGPSNGTLTLNANGSFTYTPGTNFHGSDSFTYSVSDGKGGTDTGTVTITVTGVNDAPVAANDTYTTGEDTPLTVPAPGVLDNDTDVDADPLAAAPGTGPAHGTLTLNADGSFTYTPASNFNGSDSFTYTVSDGTVTDTATVTITINPANDAPSAANDNYSATENIPLSIAFGSGVLANDSDPDGDSLTATVHTGPSNGTLLLHSNGAFTYTPAAGLTGTDSFTYTVDDGSGGTDTATVTITVGSGYTAPIAVNDTYSMVKDTSLTVPAPGVLANDSDPDGDSLTASLHTPLTEGILLVNPDGSFTYTPAAGWTGIIIFSYVVSDGSEADTGTVTITVSDSSLPSATPPPTPTPVPGIHPATPTHVPNPHPATPTPVSGTSGTTDGEQSTAPLYATLPPPPPIPLCADATGSTNTIVRAQVPPGAVLQGGVFCRVIAENGAYVNRQGGPGDIGHPDVLRYPILQAVDVYGMAGSASVSTFTYPLKICLQGEGTLFYLDATTAPRTLSMTPVTLEDGYTCTAILHAGTIVLARTGS